MAIYEKRVSVGSFLKKGEDIKDGDTVEIANEGKQVPGEFGVQDIFMVKAGEKEGNVGFNQTTINGLIDAYGPDSMKWIGKKVKVIKVKQSVSGKFIDVYYFAHPDAEFTEDGIVMPNKKKDNDEEINIEDVPF